MAKATRAATIEPEDQYRIKLKKPVRLGALTLRPRDENIVKGKRIAELGDAVESYEKV